MVSNSRSSFPTFKVVFCPHCFLLPIIQVDLSRGRVNLGLKASYFEGKSSYYSPIIYVNVSDAYLLCYAHGAPMIRS